jgi:hypothetical protein
MNINNIINLIKAYFYENWQKDLLYSFAVIATLAMFNMAFGLFNISFVLFFALVMMVLYPTKVFGNLYQSSSRMHYLTIPASNEEKVVANMLLVNVYFVIVVALALCIGYVLGYGIGYVRDPEMVNYKWEMIKETISDPGMALLILFTSTAVMFFASIYFKKSPFWKLILTGFVVSMVLGAIMAGTEWLNIVLTVPAEIRNGNYYKTVNYVTTSSEWFPYVVGCVSIVYFYAMSFLRMKETEA